MIKTINITEKHVQFCLIPTWFSLHNCKQNIFYVIMLIQLCWMAIMRIAFSRIVWFPNSDLFMFWVKIEYFGEKWSTKIDCLYYGFIAIENKCFCFKFVCFHFSHRKFHQKFSDDLSTCINMIRWLYHHHHHHSFIWLLCHANAVNYVRQ